MKKMVSNLSRIGFCVGLCLLASNAMVGATTWQVLMGEEEDRFTPDSLVISVGDSVYWTNVKAMPEPHTSTSGANCFPDLLWDSGDVNPGESWGRLFDVAGIFPYYCTYHCVEGMTGEINVRPPTAVQEASWGRVKALYR